MKKAIIVGASSGIGAELARLMSKDGYQLGVTARRTELLESLATELPAKTHIKTMDIAKTDDTIVALQELIAEMGGVDLVIVCAGIGHQNKELAWEKEREIIAVNVTGATAVMGVAMRHFIDKGCGHLVGISSIAAYMGGADCPAYNASKAYLSNYLKGLRGTAKASKKKIHITDIKPGFVDTAMAQGEGLFWVMPADKTAKQIYKAIRRKRKSTVVTKRWKIIGFMLRRFSK